MRTVLLASTLLAPLAAGAQGVITPDQGSITDTQGNVWIIQPNGSIREGDTNTPSEGGTSALTITADGTVYGQDDRTGQWFVLNAGRYWTPTPPPPDASASARTPQAIPAAVASVAPDAAAAQAAGCAAVPHAPGFGIMDGVIYGLDNQPFIPRGINVLYGNAQPAATEILARFPRTDFVRLAVYHYEQDAAFVAYVTDLTSHGLVVLIEDHNNNAGGAGGGRGAIFSGGALSTELSWDSAMGKLFLNNPMVWHASNNEPSMSVVANSGVYDGAALSQWQLAEYKAFRATGNNAPFFFELNVFGGGQTGAAIGYDPAVYAQTDNTGWDRHVYAGQASAATVASDFATSVEQAKQIKSAGGQTMAFAVFEMGDSMMGTSIDPAWRETLNTVFNAGFGWAAWGWGVGPGDNLIGGAAYEQTVAAAIAARASSTPTNPAPAGCAALASGATVVAQTQPPAPPAAPASDPQAALRGQIQQAQQQATAAEQQISAMNPGSIADNALADALAAGQARINGK